MSPQWSDYDPEGPITATQDIVNSKKREVHVWVLDFNQCTKITEDKAGCEKAAKAHWDNDPYYPRPDRTSKEDRALWDTFVEEYIRVGKNVLNGKRKNGKSSLPKMYIEAVRQECKQRFPGGPPPEGPPPPPCAALPAPSLNNEHVPSMATLAFRPKTKKASRHTRSDLDALLEV